MKFLVDLGSIKEREKEFTENGAIPALVKIFKTSDDKILMIGALQYLSILGKDSPAVCEEMRSFNVPQLICNELAANAKGTGLISTYLENLLTLNFVLLQNHIGVVTSLRRVIFNFALGGFHATECTVALYAYLEAD